MSTIWAFDSVENKYSLYCGEDGMKKFCSSLKKKMLPLTKKEVTTHQDATICYM